jgi:Ca2+/Na+ antiporter
MEVSFQSEYKMVRGGSAVLQIVTLGACLMLSVLVYQNSLYSFVLGSLTLALAFLFYMFGFQEPAEKERRSTEEL